MRFQRLKLILASGILAILASACGGGGSSNSNSNSTNNSTPQVYVSSTIASNAITFSVQQVPEGDVNIPYVSVNVCQPGTSQCQTISNILLDTGSTGLRIFSSNLNSLQLPSQTANNFPLLECASFLDGVTWGPVKVADIKLGQELAKSIPIQVVADPSYSSVPSYCSNGLPTLQSPSSLKANGILGVGLFVADGQAYYTCSSTQNSNCSAIAIAPNLQVQNPVAAFPIDNNGVVLQLSNESALGAPSASGILYFGVDTQANNSSSGANIITTNSAGRFTSTFNGVSYRSSFIDSGSNGIFFPAGSLSSTLKSCTSNSGFFCPTTAQSYSATLSLQNNQTANIAFSIDNAESLFASGNYALPTLGGNLQTQFDWGLPFFYGKNVYIGITGKSSNANTGPYYAYKVN